MERDERFYVRNRHVSQVRATAGDVRRAQENAAIGRELAQLAWDFYNTEMERRFASGESIDPREAADDLWRNAGSEERWLFDILRQEVRFAAARHGIVD